MNTSKDFEKLLEQQINSMLQNETNSIEENLDIDQEDNILDEEVEVGETKENASRSEKKKVVCKQCKKFGIWVQFGKFPNGIKRWKDEAGLICNGRICGTCNQGRAKHTMKRIRNEREYHKD